MLTCQPLDLNMQYDWTLIALIEPKTAHLFNPEAATSGRALVWHMKNKERD